MKNRGSIADVLTFGTYVMTVIGLKSLMGRTFIIIGEFKVRAR
jgi:hypothetical protein